MKNSKDETLPYKPHPKQIEFFERSEDVFFTSSYVHGTARGAITREVIRRFMNMPKYPLTDQELEQLENSYTYHPPKDDQPARYVEIRDKAKELAKTIMECAPYSRERSIALTDLEKVVTMANKAIACNE